jgi:hypothetical protein
MYIEITTKKENNQMNLPVRITQNAVEVLPDTERYKCRFKIRSASSNKLYLVSYDAAPNAGYWTCSCRGNIAHGNCKHLSSIGLRGRKFGKITLEESIQKALKG